ncbi:unnamed protein product, partial [Ectocarpus sp. 12 AP-2014]
VSIHERNLWFSVLLFLACLLEPKEIHVIIPKNNSLHPGIVARTFFPSSCHSQPPESRQPVKVGGLRYYYLQSLPFAQGSARLLTGGVQVLPFGISSGRMYCRSRRYVKNPRGIRKPKECTSECADQNKF